MAENKLKSFNGTDLINRFKEVTHSINALTQGVIKDGEDNYPAWVNQFEFKGDNAPQRDKVIIAIRQICFVDKQDPKTTIDFPGLVASSDATLALVEKVNDAKDAFKEVVLAIKHDNLMSDEQVMAALEKEGIAAVGDNVRDINVKAALRRAGIARLCLKQVYRKIQTVGYKDPVSEERVLVKPVKIGWSWAHKRSIITTTVGEEIKALEASKRDRNSVDGFTRQLLDLGANTGLEKETRLAKVQENSPVLIANRVMPSLMADGSIAVNKKEKPILVRNQASASLPMFYPANPTDGLPKIGKVPVDKVQDTSRLPRDDIKINQQAFIPALRLHLYINEKADAAA